MTVVWMLGHGSRVANASPHNHVRLDAHQIFGDAREVDIGFVLELPIFDQDGIRQ